MYRDTYSQMTETEKDNDAFDIAWDDMGRSIKLYLDTIDINILTLLCTRDITKLYPLPELPSLSNEFMNTYRNVMTKYSQEKNEYDVSKFCYFCHRQLKGLPFTCKYCKKSFHKKCVNKERGWCEAEMDTPKTSN
ncbi:hypothetical protein CRE_07242 [Caenorhabditis remanei]|uniref:Phorbol-ester/DAG-type domain-containing protein n=1 Tax=Caenorhabditis remanei TaxID=31234 RepID=E3M238_CAERE|nr:hypothetical protein CRE_07242 [Caenorhabditis remanei]